MSIKRLGNSHRLSRRWAKKSSKSRGKVIKARDLNFPSYTPIKRQKRCAWKIG